MKNILRTFASLALVLLTTACASFSAVTPGQAAAAPVVFQTPVARSATQVAAEQYYHHVWELVDQNFLYQDRLTSWKSWEHKYDGKLNSIADAEKAVDTMLNSLKDPYTFFKDESKTQAEASVAGSTGVVTYRMLPGGIGYIKITTFSSNNAAAETETACRALPGARAFILDLRGNRGGYVMQAAQVFSLFTDKAVFTTLKGTGSGKPYAEEYRLTANGIEDITNGNTSVSARRPNLIGGKPVIVLVDENSASASEMLSGALRDNGLAELLGTKTFGKGIAQWHYQLDYNTSAQVTFAQYYLPGGVCIQGPGIQPAYVVKPDASGDNQLDEAAKLLKGKIAP